jgi:hypothetical protein
VVKRSLQSDLVADCSDVRIPSLSVEHTQVAIVVADVQAETTTSGSAEPLVFRPANQPVHDPVPADVNWQEHPGRRFRQRDGTVGGVLDIEAGMVQFVQNIPNEAGWGFLRKNADRGQGKPEACEHNPSRYA